MSATRDRCVRLGSLTLASCVRTLCQRAARSARVGQSSCTVPSAAAAPAARSLGSSSPCTPRRNFTVVFHPPPHPTPPPPTPPSAPPGPTSTDPRRPPPAPRRPPPTSTDFRRPPPTPLGPVGAPPNPADLRRPPRRPPADPRRPLPTFADPYRPAPTGATAALASALSVARESRFKSSAYKSGTGSSRKVRRTTLRRPHASERARTTLRASVCSLPTWRLSHAYQTTASGHRTRELTLSRAYSASDRWIRSIRVIWTTSHRWSYAVVSHDSSYLCGLAAVW